MKKILLILIIIVLSIITLISRSDIFLFVRDLENHSAENLLLTASVLIGLKSFFALVGFPGTPLTLLSGSLLGNFFGTVIALIGNTIGATLAFLLARYVLKDWVQEKFVAKYPRMQMYEERLEGKALPTIIALRLIPLFPFNALNFLLGVTNVSLKKYVVGSFFGMIPGTFLFVYFGESLRMLSPLNIFFAIIGIIMLTYVGKFYEKNF
ncbi:MAG: hypothetical protein CO143_00025 [Candidatus Moranbacteria bacterium CG_4_9_14_3_um_filter_45_14]|nr:MAG: hypothetical protein CO143_00025 [Candidatus Moranbacteria bacterium CG_4_9_14_3_um_filter_45_14]